MPRTKIEFEKCKEAQGKNKVCKHLYTCRGTNFVYCAKFQRYVSDFFIFDYECRPPIKNLNSLED